jgi:hypothetical protein
MRGLLHVTEDGAACLHITRPAAAQFTGTREPSPSAARQCLTAKRGIILVARASDNEDAVREARCHRCSASRSDAVTPDTSDCLRCGRGGPTAGACHKFAAAVGAGVLHRTAARDAKCALVRADAGGGRVRRQHRALASFAAVAHLQGHGFPDVFGNPLPNGARTRPIVRTGILTCQHRQGQLPMGSGHSGPSRPRKVMCLGTPLRRRDSHLKLPAPTTGTSGAGTRLCVGRTTRRATGVASDDADGAAYSDVVSVYAAVGRGEVREVARAVMAATWGRC